MNYFEVVSTNNRPSSRGRFYGNYRGSERRQEFDLVLSAGNVRWLVSCFELCGVLLEELPQLLSNKTSQARRSIFLQYRGLNEGPINILPQSFTSVGAVQGNFKGQKSSDERFVFRHIRCLINGQPISRTVYSVVSMLCKAHMLARMMAPNVKE